MPINSPITIEVPTTGTQLPVNAGGISLVNTGEVTLILSPDILIEQNQFGIAPGASIQWGGGPLYAIPTPGAGPGQVLILGGIYTPTPGGQVSGEPFFDHVLIVGDAPTQFQEYPLTQGITFQALAENTANVYVGLANDSDLLGWELQPGQAGPGLPIDDASRLYVNGNTGDGVCWTGV